MLKSWRVVVKPDDRRNGEQFTMHAISETIEGAAQVARKTATRLVQEKTTDANATVRVLSVEQFADSTQLAWDSVPAHPYVAGAADLSMWEVSLSPDKPVMAMPMIVYVVAGDVYAAMAHAKRVAEDEFAHFEDNDVRYTPHSAVLVAHRVQVARKEDA
jgi:hypothetical protein